MGFGSKLKGALSGNAFKGGSGSPYSLDNLGSPFFGSAGYIGSALGLIDNPDGSTDKEGVAPPDMTGVPEGGIGYSEDADVNLSTLYKKNKAAYDGMYRPANVAMIDSLDDRQMAATGKADTDNTGNRTVKAWGRAARNAQRGGRTFDRADHHTAVHTLNRQAKVDRVDSHNRLNLEQDGRNLKMRDQLINLGRGVTDSAMGNVTAAASAQSQRDAAQQQANAQAQAAATQSSAAALSMVAMAFI